MRKSFTRLFGFLLLNVMMLFSFGLYAQETQSTVELKAPTVDVCYNANNSYTATVTTKDFVAMRSFDLTLNYDKSEFGVTSVTPVAALGGSFTYTVDNVTGKINVKWTNPNPVTIGDDAYANLFDVKFNILNFPNNSGDNLFDSPLTWDSSSKFYNGENWASGSTYQVSTTAFVGGALNVSVTYTAIQYTVSPAACDGGQAIITITSPVGAGMEYYFNGSTSSSTTGIATADAPSTNYVRVKDANGCYSHLFTIPVTAPELLVFNGATTETPTCFGENGEIQFSISGGTAPYTYWVVPSANWAQVDADLTATLGVTTSSAYNSYKYTNFQVLKPSGTYYVAVTDANGCVDLRDNANWEQVTIAAAPSQIAFTAAPTNVLCNGNTNGSIQVSGVSGGTASPTGSYTASINGVNWFAVSTTTPTYTFNNLAAGTYTVTVKDFNGCTLAKPVTITQPDAIEFTLTFQDVACGGTVTPTGSITITGVEGGSGAYQFAVAIAGTVTSTSGPSTGWVAAPGTIGSLAAGYYSIWVKDANCVKPFVNPDGSGNALPIQQPSALAVATSADNASNVEVACYGGTYTLTVTATGGTAPYAYSYDGGATTTATTYFLAGPLNSDASVVVVVTDASGCTLTKTVTVDVPTEMVASVVTGSTLSPTCSGGNDGRATVSVTGGTAPYKYSTDNVIWYDNNVLAVSEGLTNIYVKDAKQCVATTSVTITALTASTLTATVSEINCHGAKTATIAVVNTWQADRTIQYLVASTQAAVYESGTVFTPSSINTVGQTTPTTFVAGTYYLGARDEYGCTSPVIMVQIKEKAALQMTASVTNATCFGLLNGTLTINTTGGFGQPSYAIVNNSMAVGNLTAANFQPVGTWSETTSIGKQIVQVQRGTYYVVLRDGCVTDNSVFAGPFVVDGYKAITFDGTVAKTNITCNNANDGTITLPLANVKGGKPEFDGAGNYIFTLIKPVGGTVSNTTGAFTGLAGGSYTVTITDASSCSSVNTISNIVIDNPSAVTLAVTNVTHFTCKDSRNGQIAVSASGGTAGYWLAVNAVTPGTPITADNANWIAFGTTSATTTKTYIATEPGVYYLYVKDANGCIGNTVSVTVLEPAVLTPVVGTVTNVTCAGLSTGSVQINVTGGWSPTVSQTYEFKVGTTTNTTGSFTGLAAGNYTAYVKVSTGTLTSGVYVYPKVTCEYSVPFTITQPVPYSYSAVAEAVKCKSGSDGSLAVTVLGGRAATTTTTGDEYYVQLTSTATPTLSSTGWVRTTNQKYQFTGLSHGIYSVWIGNMSDGSGCVIPSGTQTPTADGVWTRSASWEVNEPALALTASATLNNNVSCYQGTNGKFTVTATGGVAPYTYATKLSTWPNLQLAPEPGSADWKTSNIFDAQGAGTWIIWVKDANGCIVGGEGTITSPVLDYRVIITQPAQVNFTPSIDTNVTCFGANNGKLKITPVTSAGQPFTIRITGVDYAGNAVDMTATSTSTTPVVSNIPANKTDGSTATNVYSVTLTDKNGCSRSINAPQFVQKKVLAVNIVKAEGAFVCPGDNNGTIEAVATGGAGTYSYRLWRDGVAYTTWVTIPSFLVEVGHTWAVEVKDANSCTATDEEIILSPVGVTASLMDITCYGDVNASAKITATGDAGRTFQVRYKVVTGEVGGVESYGPYSSWMSLTNGEIIINNLTYANNLTAAQGLYYFEIKDNLGCLAPVIKKAFVPTQHPLQATLVQEDLNASVTITGGISPYTYQVGTAAKVTLPVDGDEFQVVNLTAGSTTVTVWDAHMCLVAQSVTVAPLTVTAVPASGNNQPNMFDVELTFNRDVVAGSVNSSTLTVSSSTGTPTVTITGSGKVFKASVTGADMAAITLALTNGIMDVAGNTLTATSFMYTIGDHVAPTLVVTPPATPVATVFTVGLEFSEPVSGLLDKTGIAVTGGTILDVTGVGGKTYSVTVSSTEQTMVTVVLSNVIKDLSLNANAFAGQTMTYTTGDFTKPALVTWTPNDVTIADNHPMLKMTFSENVMLGAGGDLKIYKVATTTPTLTIPITAAMINGKDVTVNYTTTSGLDKDTRYYVLVDGTALKDNAGNTFDGVSDQAAWTFRTGLVFATPVVDIENGSLEFKVYPNPFVDYVNVENASKLSKIVVTNIAGQTVKEVVNPTQRIQLNELRSGVYFVSLYDGNTVIKTAKVIKR